MGKGRTARPAYRRRAQAGMPGSSRGEAVRLPNLRMNIIFFVRATLAFSTGRTLFGSWQGGGFYGRSEQSHPYRESGGKP
jgi:hypothetical protein